MSENGFVLYDLSTNRYTKKVLPGKFVYRIPAQTQTGQVLWGDALFLRDYITLAEEGVHIPTIQIIKMACIQEIFGLPDCAAELLITFREQISSDVDVDYCLDLLTKDMGLHKTYKSHIQKFNKNPENFYPN